MSEHATASITPLGNNPLREAQALVMELQRHTNLHQEDLKASLDKLADLLKEAESSSKSEEATALRLRLNELINNTEFMNSHLAFGLRVFLNSIIGYSDMLARPGMVGSLNEMQQKFIDTIRTNSVDLLGLITDLRYIDRLNSGHQKLNKEIVTFDQAFVKVQSFVEGLTTPLDQTVTWNLSQDLPILNNDIVVLSMVIFRLVKNALQYTPKGGSITIKAERRDNVLCFSVTDTGIGMKPEEIARLGEVFYRADHELVTSQKGYGLGIPVAMGFLKLMDSKLNVESALDKGSTFSFEIVGMG